VLNINAALRDTTAPARPRASAQTKQQLVREILDSMAAARAGGMRPGFRNLMGRSVSMTHMHVLAKLSMAGALPMSRLAEALDISVASATGIVSRMEERGLVARRRDDEDRRVVMVELADGGRAALEEIEARGREYFGRVLDQLTKDELIQVRNGFRAMHRASERIAKQEMERRSVKAPGKGQPHE
jgi:DNA-binding MarR family transcriptional regulator